MLNSYDEVQHGSPASHQSGNHFTARHNELTVTKFEFFFSSRCLIPFLTEFRQRPGQAQEVNDRWNRPKVTFNRHPRHFHTSRHKFKFEGNGRQHEFNLFHHEEIDRALSLLERDEEIAGADLKGITTKE